MILKILFQRKWETSASNKVFLNGKISAFKSFGKYILKKHAHFWGILWTKTVKFNAIHA